MIAKPVRAEHVEVPGARLYAEVYGSGSTITLIHGYTLDRRSYREMIPMLAREHQVIAYDSRGFGRSSLPGSEPYAHRDDLRALLTSLGVERTHLVGHSVGAHQVLEAALAYPELVASVSLLDQSVLTGVPFPPDVREAFAAMASLGAAGRIDEAKALWSRVGWSATAREQPALAAVMDEMLADYTGYHFSHANPVVHLDPPPGHRLDQIGQPALVVVGERTLSYNHEVASRVARGISGARKLVVPGGHMVPLEAPNEAARAVLELVASTGR